MDEDQYVHIQRIGIDLPVDENATSVEFHLSRVKYIENLDKCEQLKKLSLVSNLIQKIEHLEHNNCLEHLDLYQNKIQVIENLENLTNLKVLDLSFNEIVKIENLESLVNLEELYLSNNKISENLTLLELGSNKIKTYGDVERLRMLTALWLGKNKLTTMSLPELPNLEKCSIQNNRVKEWDECVVKNLPKLTEFYLSYNKLTEIPSFIASMSNLVILDLGNNKISRIHQLAENSTLEELWDESEVRVLTALKGLNVLYLERNPIQYKLGPSYRNRILDILPNVEFDVSIIGVLMATSEVVGKLLEHLKTRASLHLQRNKKLKDHLKPESTKNNVNNVVVRRRFTPRPLVSSPSSDYFTRLVNSSPKPLVLRSVHHPVANHLLKLSHSSNYRSYRGLVLLSSLKLIKEYCSRNGPCHRIYTTSHSNKLLSDPDVKFDKVLIVSKKLLQKIGNLHAYNNGLIAEVPLPESSSSLGIPRLILSVCPSNKVKSRINGANLGTIIRSAQALEWQGVYVLKNDQIDLFDPLTIRSSQYSLSTLPYLKGTVNEMIEFIKSNNLLACHCGNDGISVESEEFSQKLKSHSGLMLIIGHIPHELYTLSNKISVKSTDCLPSMENCSIEVGNTDIGAINNAISGHSLACRIKYSLDDQVQTGIAMYLIKKLYFKHASASPFITS